MAYQISVTFKPKYEFICSLHAYLCKKSHKKLDLTPSWAQAVNKQLPPPCIKLLDTMDINAEWKLTYSLILLSRSCDTPEQVISWLEDLPTGNLYEILAPYTKHIPADLASFQHKMIQVFRQWNDYYYKNCDQQPIHNELSAHAQERACSLTQTPYETFIDDTTSGLMFSQVEEIETLLLIPQYHFQPVNVIYQYGKLLFCHYSSRLDLNQGAFMSAHHYRMIRSIAEKSRLKILRFLHSGPKSFIEIVRELNLSKGITHDHVSKLRFAGLIYAHFEGETLTTYSLRMKGLEQMQRQIINYIEH